jgi:hypothetical protein
LKSPRNDTGIAMTNLHRSPPMNQSKTDLGIVNESQLLRFGIRGSASPIGRGNISMQEYDLYLNPQKPAVGLYVQKGAGLPDLADPKEWIFDGTAAQAELPADLVKRIATNSHAFRDMD